MKFRLFTICAICMFLASGAWASKIFIPMDATGQTNHLKAYGVAYAAMLRGIKVQWLLNYKGGSFGMDNDKDIEQICRQRGVSYTKMSNKQYAAILKKITNPAFNGQVVLLEKAPKIAVYTPPDKKPWDDAVTLALTYAEIPFDKLYAGEVLAGNLDKYDWLHLHHEDFTGQYGKFWGQFRNAPWYQQDVKTMEELAAKNGFKKVSQMQLAVVKKIRDFVAGGGNMFAMCSATQTFDIALAAEGTDICDVPFDGDAADTDAQSKLDYTNCLAFKDFKVSLNPYQYAHSNIDNTNYRQIAYANYEVKKVDLKSNSPINREPIPQLQKDNDFFTLLIPPAKFDQVPAMLCQNHTKAIKGFMGQTTAFRKEILKPGVQVMGDFIPANEARYIHGESGKGSWTFLGGHDPEDYQHLVNNPPTDLSLYPNSPGYRLILNNVLFPAVKKTVVPTVVIKAAEHKDAATTSTQHVLAEKDIRIYPNPANNELVISFATGKIEQVTILNLNGQEVFNQAYNTTKVNVEMKDIPAGMYLIKVNGEYAGKVVKE